MNYPEEAHAEKLLEQGWLSNDQADILRDKVATLIAQLAQVTAERDGHVDSLRSIKQMEPSDGARMRQWAADSLTGYVEPLSVTLWQMQQRAEQAESAIASREGLAGDVERYRFLCQERAGWISSYARAHWPWGNNLTTKYCMDHALDRAMLAAVKEKPSE